MNDKNHLPNHAQVPNLIIESLPILTEAEVKIILVLSQEAGTEESIKKATGLSAEQFHEGIMLLHVKGWISEKVISVFSIAYSKEGR